MTHEPYRPRGERRSVKVSDEVKVSGADGEAPLTLTCRWPAGDEPKAIILFCHGLGRGGRDYAELSEFWASHGYLVIHPTFPDWIVAVASAEPGLGLDPGTDLTDWAKMPRVRTRMHEILHDPAAWMARIRIVRQVMRSLDSILASTGGRQTQPIPIAIAGHSFGAYVSQLFAGAEIDMPGNAACRFRDERFEAAILLSPQGRDQQGLRDGSWDRMTVPVLTVTGTLDRGAKNQDWRWKSEPFELAPPGDKYLAVLDGGDHYLGGIAAIAPRSGNIEQRHAVSELTLAFLDAHVSGDTAARTWLATIVDRIGSCPVLFRRN